MSIALTLPGASNVGSYDQLISYVIDHLELDETTQAQVPTFIQMAEARLDRLLTIPQRRETVTLATTAGTREVALPSNVRAIRDVSGLTEVTLQDLNDNWSEDPGEPEVYAIGNGQILLGPAPASASTLTLTHNAALAPLTPNNQTNWLLVNNPDAYIYGTMWQAASYLQDERTALAFRGELFAIIEEVNMQGQAYRYGGTLVPNLGCVP